MPDDSQGRIRYAAHHLLIEWSTYDDRCAETIAEARREADALAPILDGIPDAGELTAQIGDIMRAGTSQAETELRQAGERYAVEARTLLGLLTRQPDLASLPFTLPDPGSGLPGIIATFPTDGSRRYATLVFDDQPASGTISITVTQETSVNGPEPVREQVTAFTDRFPPQLQATVNDMVTHARSHALQAHGPDVIDDALKARVTWRKDPVGRTNNAHRWTVTDDGTVVTNHGVGAMASKFTTMDAIAKPLQALLAATENTMAGLDAYLASAAVGRTARIFVPAAECGLEPGDTTAYRGAGTQTDDMAKDWAHARDFAMGSGADPMPIVPTDPVADGLDPGAAMSFRKSGDHWIMTTCYPAPTPDERFTRLRSADS